MDCCCSGAYHSLVASCSEEKPPGCGIPVARLHRQVLAPSSLKNQNYTVFSNSHRASPFTPARNGNSGELFTFRHVKTSIYSNLPCENQSTPSDSSSNDDNDSDRCNEQNQNAVTQLPADSVHSEIEIDSTINATTASNKHFDHARDTNGLDDIAVPSLPSWDDTTPSPKGDEQNAKGPLPESLADEMKKPGPLKDIQNHVSGKVSSSPSRDSDSSLSHLLASRNIIEFISRFPSWADAQKESGMPQRQQRSFYSHEDWRRHRSSLRYIRHVISSVSSRVIVALVPPVFTFTTVALIIAVYNTAVGYGYLAFFLPKLHATSLPYALTAPALALLLVFRTDASYSRYNEAKGTWTSIISSTKDLARLSAQLIRDPQDMGLKASLLSYILAFPVALKCHLIDGSDTLTELERFLESYDLAFVLSSEHRPNCLIQLISQSLSLLHLGDTDRVILEDHVQQFVASVNICERLLFTPIPFSYTRLTSRFLVLWHVGLPIVLWDACGWLVIPATFFSAATLFCIDEVGVLIEEPFPMLTLDKMIGLAHESIHELLKRQQETDHFLSLKRKQSNK